MRSAWGLVMLAAAGCGRVGFTEHASHVVDSAPDAVPDAVPDAPPDAPPMLLETMTIPSDGTIKFSNTVLDLGVPYLLIARGTYTAVPPAGDPRGDAEYYDLTNPAGANDGGGSVDLGLAIDDPTVDMTKTPKWGPYRPDSVYTLPFTGKGAKISAAIHDCCYGDNVGSLTLEIYR